MQVAALGMNPGRGDLGKSAGNKRGPAATRLHNAPGRFVQLSAWGARAGWVGFGRCSTDGCRVVGGENFE